MNLNTNNVLQTYEVIETFNRCDYKKKAVLEAIQSKSLLTFSEFNTKDNIYDKITNNEFSTIIRDWTVSAQFTKFVLGHNNNSFMQYRSVPSVIIINTILTICHSYGMCPLDLEMFNLVFTSVNTKVSRSAKNKLIDIICKSDLFAVVKCKDITNNPDPSNTKLLLILNNCLFCANDNINLMSNCLTGILPFSRDDNYITEASKQLLSFMYTTQQHIDEEVVKRDILNDYTGLGSNTFTFEASKQFPNIKGNALIVWNLMQELNNYLFMGHPQFISMANIQHLTGLAEIEVFDLINYMCAEIGPLTARWVWTCEPEVPKSPTLLYLQFSYHPTITQYELDENGCCKLYEPCLSKNRVSGMCGTAWVTNDCADRIIYNLGESILTAKTNIL